MMLILAFYFSMLVPGQDWPVMIGPYGTWADCATVRELFDKWGHETDSCSLLPIQQDSTQIVIRMP